MIFMQIRSRLARPATCLVAFLGVLSGLLFSAEKKPLLSPVFGDHMVLQRGKPVTVWGWDEPGATVTVVMRGKCYETVTDAQGAWSLELETLPAGGPYALTVKDAHQERNLTDVLVGEVWVFSGQSNMEFELNRARGGSQEAATSEHPGLRLFKVPARSSYMDTPVPEGSWQLCSASENKGMPGGFSAVAYYFGCRLERELGVPVGLIESCLGGSPIESWMSPRSLSAMREYAVRMKEIERLSATGTYRYGSFLMHWLNQYDKGSVGTGWQVEGLDEHEWRALTLPGSLDALSDTEIPGIFWFRREVTLPDPLPAGAVRLCLGVVDKMDTVYVNGRWVGASSWVENPRRYSVPAGVLRPGRNLVAIRLFKNREKGGFLSEAGSLALEFDSGLHIPLSGEWKGRLSEDARAPHPMPLDLENYPTMPSVLYQGMLKPLAPLPIAGFVWYQGEANFSHAFAYRNLLPRLIGDWRADFGQGDLPFVIISLPAFMKHREMPGSDGWTELREAQSQTAAMVRNCALAVTLDTGDADNIHPEEKKPVGERAAGCALHLAYGRKVPAGGPQVSVVEQEGAQLRIRFSNTEGGLRAAALGLHGFELCGADRSWHGAEARIEGDSVVLRASTVTHPVAARYGWQANPEASLFNEAGLPANSFRTDAFPGSTE